jgi:hypothetical protein
MNEAAKKSRRVNGCLDLPALRAALHKHLTIALTPTCDNQAAA